MLILGTTLLPMDNGETIAEAISNGNAIGSSNELLHEKECGQKGGYVYSLQK